MMSQQLNLFISGLCLSALVANSIGSDCPGPLKHYEALGCKPIRRSPDDACAYKYDCDHLKNRPADKCIIGKNVYNIGESLKDDDANPCDIACTCSMGNDIAQFNCAAVDCPPPAFVREGCYSRKNASLCCSDGEVICPKSLDARPSCKVGEKTYKDGEYFEVGDKSCYCGPDFSMENLDSFCHTPKADPCSLELHYASDIKNNCPPVFYSSQPPQTSCGIAFRCANSRDKIIKNEGAGKSSGSKTGSSEEQDSASKCIFGNMLLNIGDSLKPATDYDSVCVDCVCEIPPVLTCRRLPDNECDSTKHDDFSKNS